MSLIPNVTEFYISSEGNILETKGSSLFYAQNNYANLIIINLEDGVSENSSTFINFTPNKRTAYTSHWFFVSYIGIVERVITGENIPRTFAQFAIKIPNIVLQNNSQSLTITNKITIIQRYGSNYKGFFNSLTDLENEWSLTSPSTNLDYDTIGEEFASELSVAYVLGGEDLGFYQVALVGGVYEWVIASDVSQYLTTKQYDITDITIQPGFSNVLDVTPIETSTTAYIMQLIQNLEQQIKSIEIIAISGIGFGIFYDENLPDVEDRYVGLTYFDE